MPGPCLGAKVQSAPPYLRESTMPVLCLEAKVQGVLCLRDITMPFPCLGAEVQGVPSYLRDVLLVFTTSLQTPRKSSNAIGE